MFNICTTGKECIGSNVRISLVRYVGTFKGIWSSSNIRWCLCTCLRTSVHPEVGTWTLVQEELKKNCTDLKTQSRLLSVFSKIFLCENSRYIITVRHCVRCAKGRKGQRQFTCHLFSYITGTEANNLLFIFLRLIANLALVSGDCEFGTPKLNDFDWSNFGH